jgi:uncharacterized membrane protein YtjA (UPF0391 family)
MEGANDTLRHVSKNEEETETKPTKPMLHYAVVFLIVAIIAAVLGFGVIAGTAAWIAKILFVVFLILAVISFLKKST